MNNTITPMSNNTTSAFVDSIVDSIDHLTLGDDIAAKQRAVSENLGKNITYNHSKIYDVVEKRLGRSWKRCTFGHKRGSKTGVKHEGVLEVPIRDFELKGCSIDGEGNVVITGGDGLQGFCRNCSKLRRQARIAQEKSKKENKSFDEIKAMYIAKYKTDKKTCSRCKEDLLLEHFNLSIGMECGFHNMCKVCSYEYGCSVGERWILYLPDGNFKYNKSSRDTHDDHIFPLSLGGSNEEINHQLLDSKTNIQKSNELHFESVRAIDPMLLGARFRHVLRETDNMSELKRILSEKIHNDILERSKLSDDKLKELYSSYCTAQNMRRNIDRAVRKFRQYCKLKF